MLGFLQFTVIVLNTFYLILLILALIVIKFHSGNAKSSKAQLPRIKQDNAYLGALVTKVSCPLMKSFVPLSKKRSAVALYARKLEINDVIDGKAQKILVMSKDDVGDILQIIRLLKNFYRNIKSYNTYYCHQNKETEICIHKYTSCCIRSQSIRKSPIK